MVVSSAFEASIGLAAGVRLAAALPELPYACGLATGLLFAEDVVTRPLRPVGGVLKANVAADLAVRDPLLSPPEGRVRWLVARLERILEVTESHRLSPDQRFRAATAE